MSNPPQELYREREKRVLDAIACKVPDRVPVLPFFGAFSAQYAGITAKEALYDYAKALDATYKTIIDFEPDMAPGAMSFGPTMEALEYKQLKWAGYNLGENTGYQFVDGEYMKADEYDAFLYDPTDFILRAYWPRIFGKLGVFGQMQPLRDIICYYMGAGTGGFIPFGTPGGVAALEALKKAGEEGLKMMSNMVAYGKRVAAAGFPSLMGAGTQAPFDTLSDFFRGTREVMFDMFRMPEKVEAAAEKILPIMLEMAIGNAKASGNSRVFIPLHKGQEGFMSIAQYERFYWPTFKALLEGMVAAGLTPVVLAEGCYTSRLDYLARLPEGKILFWFEEVDMALAKKKLAGKVCIMGNVPMGLMVGGSPDEVRAYCRKTIDECARDGGYIMSAAAVMDDSKPENVRAMMDATREYGVY